MTIRLNFSSQVTNGDFRDTFAPGQQSIDQENQDYWASVLTVPVEGADVVIEDMDNQGFAIFRNLDTSNEITLGTTDGTNQVDFAVIKAGEFCFFRLEPETDYSAYVSTDGSGAAASLMEVRVYGA